MRNSALVTITAGTVQRLCALGIPTALAKDLIITPMPGAAADLIYVINFNPDTVTPTNNAQTLVTVLAKATTTAPGEKFTLNRSQPGSEQLTINEWGIDGAHTGDTVQVSWELSPS